MSVAPLGFKRAPRDGPQTSRLGRFFRGITRDLTSSRNQLVAVTVLNPVTATNLT